MKNPCKSFQSRLIDLAEGRQDAVAQAHVDSCPKCRAEVVKLARVLSAMPDAGVSAPASWVERAKSLFPRKVWKARLLPGALAPAVRGSNRISATYECEEAPEAIIVEYRREGRAWSVIGTAPEGDWSGETASGQFDVSPNGRFSFKAATLPQTGFRLEGSDGTIEVPPATAEGQ